MLNIQYIKLHVCSGIVFSHENGATGLYMLLFYGKKKAKVHKSV